MMDTGSLEAIVTLGGGLLFGLGTVAYGFAMKRWSARQHRQWKAGSDARTLGVPHSKCSCRDCAAWRKEAYL